MNLTASALKNPAGLAVGVAIILFFGLFSIGKLPIQLFPDVDEPQINIETRWRAASPREVESEILEPQEEVLQGLPGLRNLDTNANRGVAWVSLEFGLDTDMQQTLIDVISRLNRLPPLPRDAEAPIIHLGEGGGGANQALIFFFVQLLPGTDGAIDDYRPLVEELVIPRLESIPGVAGASVTTGASEQLQIVFDPYRAAELGVDIPTVAGIVNQANDVSGGFVDVGRRQYTLRFAGRYTPEQLRGLILDWRDGRPIRLGDIADVRIRRADRADVSIQNGNPAMAIRVDRENGANVLETLNAVKAEVDALRDGPLAPYGLTMQQSFDASVFIYRAVNLVTGNLFIGILLAVGVLWWFLRRGRATLLVALAIPVSVLATFVVLNLAGRTLNVISLAGIAFAVGMVLDAAIVVLENIVRLRERGEHPDRASLEGASQVWGALLASTATTVAIFLPVIFLKDAAGQLFADLALTIAIAVTISLLVAVTVLPLAARRWLPDVPLKDAHADAWSRLAGRLVRLTGSPARRWALIATLMTVPLVATWKLVPPLDYLPPVKRDAVDAYFQFPPGANNRTIKQEIVDVMVERLAPYMAGEKEPALKNYYILTWPNGGTLGIRARDQGRVAELQQLVREEITVGFPDTQAFAAQGNLFGGFGGSRNVSIMLQSRDPEALLEAGRLGMGLVQQELAGAQVQPWPGLELAQPELRLTPNDQRIIESGWSRGNVATVMRALGDGLWVGEHFDGDKRMDVILRAEGWENPEELANVPLATPSGAVLPLGELVAIDRTVGPNTIHRVDGRRTLRLNVNPPERMSLEETLTAIKERVEPRLREALPADGTIQYGGSAGALESALANLSENFLLALLVLFLLMSALFRSLKDSLLVLLCLPLATVGGVAAMQILNVITFQPLDLLSMIGFIILMGLVVNNAILLVHQTRCGERDGLNRADAVAQALRLRLRPIFMSTLTSIFGMLPLVLMPGAGSVIYRGLATVIVGGMSVSTLFTLVLLPCLLRVGEHRARHGHGHGLTDAGRREGRLAGACRVKPFMSDSATTPRIKVMQRRFVSQILLAALGATFMIWSLAADAQQPPPPAPVEVAEAEALSMAATVLAPGTVYSRNDATVAAEVAGTLRTVAEVGDRVQAGEVIAAIDDSDLQLQLRYGDATIRRLEASLKYLNSQLERQRKLASQNIAARNELDETESQRDMMAQELVQARISREQTELLIEKSRVRAPFSGRIVARHRDAGEYIAVGGELVRLVDTDNVEIRAQAPMSVAGYLREGTDVVVHDGDRRVPANIRTVIPIGDERSRMIEVRIDLAEPGWVIGAAVRVAVPEAAPVPVVAVPRDALILRQNATYVFRVNADNTAEQVAVSTGIGDGGMIEVKGKVAAGDRVVIRGGETLRPGQAVAVAETGRTHADDADVKLASKG